MASANRRIAHRHRSVGFLPSHQPDPPWRARPQVGRLLYHCPVVQLPWRSVHLGYECVARRAFCPAGRVARRAFCPAGRVARRAFCPAGRVARRAFCPAGRVARRAFCPAGHAAPCDVFTVSAVFTDAVELCSHSSDQGEETDAGCDDRRGDLRAHERNLLQVAVAQHSKSLGSVDGQASRGRGIVLGAVAYWLRRLMA